jgi:lysophospholipase L1-like esterase
MLGVFLLLAAAMWMTPSGGIKTGEFIFHMPSFKEMFLDEGPGYVDVSQILEEQFSIDSLLFQEDGSGDESVLKADYDSLAAKIHLINMSDTARLKLSRFFDRFESDKLVRIMHYGDSQIEGDRITAFVRDKLQKRFGGSGIGLRPALQPYDFILSAAQNNSRNWKRFPLYGKIDSLVEHNKYGMMAAFSRFAPVVSDTIPVMDTIYYEADLSIEKTAVSFKRARTYKHFRLYYGNAKSPVKMELMAGDSIILADTLKAHVDFAVAEADLPDTTGRVSLRFSGYDSPDIYGMELASQRGVIVDNIALRGSSGLFFTRNDFEHSLKIYQELNPGLFILQFGGNVVPYITRQEDIERYGRWFSAQIRRLKQTCPEAAIIVIGPGDMSTKEKDRYVTYEHLPYVVEVLKEAALSSDCAFWDMYEAMGGYNSMPSWVNAEPELARPDYVHFSMRGARLIANMFYNALIFEYSTHLQEKSEKE